MLKKYQLIEPLDVLEELNESTRLLIYPCIHAVLQGDAVREVLESFGSSRGRRGGDSWETLDNRQPFWAISKICLNNWHYIDRKY